MQVLIMTSDHKEKIVTGFFHQWHKYFKSTWDTDIILCGFSPIPNYNVFKIGDFADYPANRWSDALIKVLDIIADEVFLLLLDDYWLTRPVDTNALKMMYDYMYQFQNVIKFDVTDERLYVDSGSHYLYGYNTYDTLGYLDLIKSSHHSPYHMSLWGGLWRRDLLKRILVPNETAQQIELNGTSRLAQYGDEFLVLGTRQTPLRHANVIQGGVWNNSTTVGVPALKDSDREALKELGVL